MRTLELRPGRKVQRPSGPAVRKDKERPQSNGPREQQLCREPRALVLHYDDIGSSAMAQRGGGAHSLVGGVPGGSPGSVPLSIVVGVDVVLGQAGAVWP